MASTPFSVIRPSSPARSWRPRIFKSASPRPKSVMSIAVTAWPRAARALRNAMPIRPAPPVTSTFICNLSAAVARFGCSQRDHAPVYPDVCASHEARTLRAEEEDHGGHVVGGREAADRREGQERSALLVGDILLNAGHRGAGGNRIDLDVERGVLHARLTGERQHRGFRSAIGGGVPEADMRRRRSDVANLAALVLDHAWQHRFHPEPDALGVDIHDAIPDVLRNVDGRVAGNDDARIVDQDIDGAEAVQR